MQFCKPCLGFGEQQAEDVAFCFLGEVHLNGLADLAELERGDESSRGQRLQGRLQVFAVFLKDAANFRFALLLVGNGVLADKGPEDRFGNVPLDFVVLVEVNTILGAVLNNVAGEQQRFVFLQVEGKILELLSNFLQCSILVSPLPFPFPQPGLLLLRKAQKLLDLVDFQPIEHKAVDKLLLKAFYLRGLY